MNNSKLKLFIESIVKEVLSESSGKEPTKEQIDATFDLLKTHTRKTRFDGKVFVAGGAVRDMIMGKDPKDIDVVVEMEEGGIKFANYIASKLGIFKPGSNPVVFERFGTAKVALDGVVHNGVLLDGVDVEFVNTRTEEYEEGSRKPTTKFGTIKQDVMRRDLTINSLLMNLVSGEIVDLTGQGREDITKGVIRTPSEPNRIFQDDPLRLMRAVRFTGRYKYTLPDFMEKSIKDNAPTLKTISKERIREELMKILSGANPEVGMRLLFDLDLMPYISPALANNKESSVEGAKIGNDVVDRLIMIYSVLPSNIVEKELRTLKFPNDEVSEISKTVKSYREISGDDSSESILKAGSDLVQSGNESHINILKLASKKVSGLEKYFFKGPVVHVSPNELMQIFNIKPGAKIGKLVAFQKQLWYKNPNISKDEALKQIEKVVLQ